MTEGQRNATKRRGGRARARNAAAGLLRDARPLITEEMVQQAVVDYLQLDGWRAFRTDPVSNRGRGKGFGELGMPDYLFIRYAARGMPAAHVLWIEFKRPGKQPDKHQAAWHALEKWRGATVLTVDSLDSFRIWYRQSGLRWRVDAA